MHEKTESQLLKELEDCFDLLSRRKGDGNWWSSTLLKILSSIDSRLDDLFRGFEDEDSRIETGRSLRLAEKTCSVPAEKKPPCRIPDILSGEWPQQPSSRSLRLPDLFSCCCFMLSSSYPHPVHVPVRAILSLVERTLAVSGSLSKAKPLSSFVTRASRDSVSSQLPLLHSSSLDLLILINSFSSHLLPHAARILRVTTRFLKSSSAPSLRAKAYHTVKIFLISMGSGMAIDVAADVIEIASADLNPVNRSSGDATMMVTDNKNKKRKRSTVVDEISGSSSEEDGGGDEFLLKISALDTLEALVASAGGGLNLKKKKKMNALLMNVASAALEFGVDEKPHAVDYRIASMRALLSCLLSCDGAPPLFLAGGLQLFNRGRRNVSHPSIASFCSSALLSLQSLLRVHHHHHHQHEISPPPSMEEDGELGRDELYDKYYNGRDEGIDASMVTAGHQSLSAQVDDADDDGGDRLDDATTVNGGDDGRDDATTFNGGGDGRGGATTVDGGDGGGDDGRGGATTVNGGDGGGDDGRDLHVDDGDVRSVCVVDDVVAALGGIEDVFSSSSCECLFPDVVDGDPDSDAD